MKKLEIIKVEKSFGVKTLLQEINFECRSGEILGVFGRNGSGKSTLFKIIFGTLKYEQFEALLDHENYDPGLNIRKQQIAYMPQDPMSPHNLRVRDLVSLFYPDPEKQDRLLYNPRIAGFDSLRFGQLSAGEKKYFEMMLISQLPHPVMIFDEPFSMMDPMEQEHISELLQNLKKDKIIIISDHYYREVLHITDRNILINHGKVQEINTLDDLIQGAYLKQPST